MLFGNMIEIGNRLLTIRKQYGMTQNDVAEAAGLSMRTYADIERGTVNMRIDTFLSICDALHVTPNEVLTKDENDLSVTESELFERLNACSPKDRETALKLLYVYLESLK